MHGEASQMLCPPSHCRLPRAVIDGCRTELSSASNDFSIDAWGLRVSPITNVIIPAQ